LRRPHYFPTSTTPDLSELRSSLQLRGPMLALQFDCSLCVIIQLSGASVKRKRSAKEPGSGDQRKSTCLSSPNVLEGGLCYAGKGDGGGRSAQALLSGLVVDEVPSVSVIQLSKRRCKNTYKLRLCTSAALLRLQGTSARRTNAKVD